MLNQQHQKTDSKSRQKCKQLETKYMHNKYSETIKGVNKIKNYCKSNHL